MYLDKKFISSRRRPPLAPLGSVRSIYVGGWQLITIPRWTKIFIVPPRRVLVFLRGRVVRRSPHPPTHPRTHAWYARMYIHTRNFTQFIYMYYIHFVCTTYTSYTSTYLHTTRCALHTCAHCAPPLACGTPPPASSHCEPSRTRRPPSCTHHLVPKEHWPLGV